MRLAGEHGVFPGTPVGGGLCGYSGVFAVHQAGVGGDDVAVTLGLGNTSAEAFPSLGEEARYAALQPVDLGPASGGDAVEDDPGDTAGVLLGIGQNQGRPPGAAEQQPTVNAEVLAQVLEVPDQMRSRVVAHVGGRVTRAGRPPQRRWSKSTTR